MDCCIVFIEKKGLVKTKNLPVKLSVASGARKIIEGFIRYTDNMGPNELRSFPGAVFRVFDATLPLHDSPPCIVVLRKLTKNCFKVNLSISRRPVPSGPVQPALVATKCSLPAGWIEL